MLVGRAADPMRAADPLIRDSSALVLEGLWPRDAAGTSIEPEGLAETVRNS
jgi:hypothetical protein